MFQRSFSTMTGPLRVNPPQCGNFCLFLSSLTCRFGTKTGYPTLLTFMVEWITGVATSQRRISPKQVGIG